MILQILLIHVKCIHFALYDLKTQRLQHRRKAREEEDTDMARVD